MIINETARFAFVHIPKCAGTTVRVTLSRFDEASARFYDKRVSDHPVFGPLDYPHIPLAILKEHFPRDFARLRTYRAFALLRDPFSRFPSSLHERFVQRDGARIDGRTRHEIAREIDTVTAKLARLPRDLPVADPALIHFSRQRDYVFLDGAQVVDRPRTVAAVEALIDEISGLLGEPIKIAKRKNSSYSYALPGLGRLQRAVTRRIEAAVPRRVWEPAHVPIKKALRASGLLRSGDDPLAVFENANEIKAFMGVFCADDIALFRRLDKARRKRAGKGGET